MCSTGWCSTFSTRANELCAGLGTNSGLTRRGSRLEIGWIIGFGLVCFIAAGLANTPLYAGTVRLRVVRDGVPLSGVDVRLVEMETGAERLDRTDHRGIVVFPNLVPGRYVLSAEGIERLLAVVSSQGLCLNVAVGRLWRSGEGRFGRSALTRHELERKPHGGTVGAVLETLEPVAVTDRVDVAGIEGSTRALWGVRGSSWTQNQVVLDGADITEPAGGRSLLYPDPTFFEEIALDSAVQGAEASSPGAKLELVSRVPPLSLQGSTVFRYTGSALQWANLDPKLVALGVEPREFESHPSGRFEVGASGFYGAVNGDRLSSRLPRFEGLERSSLLAATGKLARERWSLLGIAQRFRRPTLGARPDVAPEATVDATETFQVVQGSVRGGRGAVLLSYARSDASVHSAATSSPLHDLATGRIEDAPLLTTEGERTRFGAVAHGERLQGGHLLSGGVEWSHAEEDVRETVPSGMQRLTVDGKAHAVALFTGSGERAVSLGRMAVHLQDTFFFRFLGRSWHLSPGARIDWSRSGPIHWFNLTGTVSARVALWPSSELQLSLSRYPHVLTSRLRAAAEGSLSWEWRRWRDDDGDRLVSPAEVGMPMRRGGPAFTSIAADLPRPMTNEVAIGAEKHFARGLLRVNGYHRWEKGLLQTVNVGIADASYERLAFEDVGLDGVLGTSDDERLTIFDQREQLGEDLFLLTHPPGLDGFSQGVDVLLQFDHGPVFWSLSGRAYRDVGSSSPGNGPQENDTGILGDLFNDPNTLTHAEGRLFFDRAFTGKLSLTARLPGRIDLGAAVRYWDGQPFARQLFFPDLGQGFTVVQALPRGRQRYTFNMTVDLRLEKDLSFRVGRLGLAIEVFNLLNQTLETAENVRSGEEFRQTTAVQPARTIVLEGRLRF
jgi:hypothetical protein